MTLKISHKLLLAFISLTLIVLVSTHGLARWSFKQGFLNYVNAVEEKRLTALSAALAIEYSKGDNTWDTLTEHRFQVLLNRYARETPSTANNSAHPNRPPPPEFDFESPRLRPPPPRGRPDRGPPTALYDALGDLVVGTRINDSEVKPIRLPITVDEKVVGELRSAPKRQFESPQETQFSKQQWTTSILIAVMALVLAIAVSLLLIRMLLAPIRRSIDGISKLSNGDYATRLNEQRKDELGQLMNDLDRLAYTLEQNQASRKRWLADISHELRTPVTVLTGEIEAMKDGIRPLNHEQLLSIDQEISRLRHLIDDLSQLAISDIGGLRYSFCEIDIQAIVSSAIESAKNRASERHIEIKLEANQNYAINADPQRLDQLFVNLLENAMAYTDPPGQITIELSQTESDVTITINDTPPGINPDECEKLFEPLYRQESSRNRRTAGIGLGLAICRNIVEAHQGKITAKPSALGGLCMEIVLPRAARKL